MSDAGAARRPGTSPAVRPSAATRVAQRLETAFDAVLGAAYRRSPGQRVDVHEDGLVIRSHDLLERCPRRAASPADDYEDRVMTTQRRVGLLVLRRLWATSSGPHTGGRAGAESLVPTVRAVFDDPEVWPTRLWSWVRSLDPAGRAAVAAGAVTWCDGVLRTVGSARDISWVDPSSSVRRDVPGRAVALVATLDATRRAADGERLLVVTNVASPVARRVLAGHAALVRTAVSRRDPVARVTLAVPPTGQLHQIPVDDALLELAVDRVVELAALRSRPGDAPPRPSRACAHCHLLDVCDDGRQHLGTGTATSPDGRAQSGSGDEPTT